MVIEVSKEEHRGGIVESQFLEGRAGGLIWKRDVDGEKEPLA